LATQPKHEPGGYLDGVTCRGSYALGTACGHCARCIKDPAHPMNAALCRVDDKAIAAAMARRQARVPVPPGSRREHQLHMARYYVHKLLVKKYYDQMLTGELSAFQATQMYKMAMSNYDLLQVQAAPGGFTAADQLDMERGFPYSDD